MSEKVSDLYEGTYRSLSSISKNLIWGGKGEASAREKRLEIKKPQDRSSEDTDSWVDQGFYRTGSLPRFRGGGAQPLGLECISTAQFTPTGNTGLMGGG